jgi:hypothetical protein
VTSVPASLRNPTTRIGGSSIRRRWNPRNPRPRATRPDKRTLLREAEEKLNKTRDPKEIFDSLYVIEASMSYFFMQAELGKHSGARKPEEIRQDYRDAAQLASLAAPFRHSRLTAVKILGDPNNPVHFRDDATAEELRAEIMKRLEILISAGLIDLAALPVPSDGIVKGPKPGVDQSGLHGT